MIAAIASTRWFYRQDQKHDTAADIATSASGEGALLTIYMTLRSDELGQFDLLIDAPGAERLAKELAALAAGRRKPEWR